MGGTRRGRWLWGCAAVALLLVLSQLGPGPDPIASQAELRLAQIYGAVEWTRRVPVEVATAWIARAKLHDYLDGLDLPDEVRARVDARLDAPDFVDELVPFLIAVKELYLPGDDDLAPPSFDEHLRASFSPADAIPGMEHDMFAWQPESQGGAGLPALDPELAVQLVRFYDALYLRDHGRDEHLGQRLACESRSLEYGLREAAAEAQPAVRELLEGFSGSLEPGSDLEAGLQRLLDDGVRLEAATASVIQFIDQLVCKHYRSFATRLMRAEQLRDWLEGELAKPGNGALWAWLDHAARTRRYGVLVVVDGLEGSLVRALAAGRPDDPFVGQLLAERARGRERRLASPAARTPPATRNEFLTHFARAGFRHPDYLPFFRRLHASPQAHLAGIGVSTTPTISVRNLPIAKTGAPVAGPGGTGIPNFHFVDRVGDGRAWYFYGNDAVQLGALTRAAGMRSLFERLPGLSSLSCASQYDEAAGQSIDAFLDLGIGERVRDFGERLCLHELARRRRQRERALELVAALEERHAVLSTRFRWFQQWLRWGQRSELRLARLHLAELARLDQESLPELLVVYVPWPDHFAHFEGPFADEIIAPSGELNRLDYWLGRIEAVYREAGVAPRTVFGMAGDHGLVPVFQLLNPEVEVFDALRAEGQDFRVVKISSDEGEGPKLTNPFDPPSMRGIDVVVASTAGGNYMLDLFVDQDEHWSQQPLYADLLAVKPLAAGRDAPAIDLVWELASRLSDSLDYLALRETPCDVDGGSVRLVAVRPEGRADAFVRRQGDRLYYRFEGADLLEIGRLTPYESLDQAALARHAQLQQRCLTDADPERPESWCDERSWRELASYTPRPDSVVQIGHLYDTPRAGSVNLFPAAGIGYNSIVPGRHAGESFHEKNAFAGVWGEPLAPRDPQHPLRSVVIGSVPMAIYQHLTGERPTRGVDGWGYDPLDDAIFTATPRSGTDPAPPGSAPAHR